LFNSLNFGELRKVSYLLDVDFPLDEELRSQFYYDPLDIFLDPGHPEGPIVYKPVPDVEARPNKNQV